MNTNHHSTYARLKLLSVVALIIGVGLFATSKFITERTNSDLLEANKHVIHTHKVLAQTNDILIQIQGLQNSSRGFLLSNDSQFLEAIDSYKNQADSSIVSLLALTTDNPNQTNLLEKLQATFQFYKHYQTEMIQLARNGDAAGAINKFKTLKGKKFVEEIMVYASEIESNENALLETRKAKSQQLFALLDQINLAITLLASAVFFLFFLFIFKALSKRETLEKELQNEIGLRQHLLEQMPVGLLILDASGEVYFMNFIAKTYLLPSGTKDSKKVMGTLLIHPDFKDQPQHLSELIKDTKKGHRIEYNGLVPDLNRDLSLQLCAEQIKSVNGQLGYTLVVLDKSRQ